MSDPIDASVPMWCRIVELIDAVPAHVPDTNGRPVAQITLAYRGELEQPIVLSFEDTKVLVTKLLESLDVHGHKPSRWLLKEYFQANDRPEDDDDED